MLDNGVIPPSASPAGDSQVTEDEIRQFKGTLLARRFPGLRDLTEHDIRALIIHNWRVLGKGGEILPKTYPKTDFQPAEHNKDPPHPVFVPANTSEAKNSVKRANKDSFSSVGTPYEAHHMDFLADKASDESKRVADQAFLPTCTSKAREEIRVDYYLNSADELTKATQKMTTKMRSTVNLAAYNDATTTARKGNTFM